MQKKIEKLREIIEKIKNSSTVETLWNFLDWFWEKLKIEFLNKKNKFIPKKWDIFYVNLWKNIWSELNKLRPCVVISKRKFNVWWTIIVVPLRSYKWKDKKYFIKIYPDDKNNLWKTSQVDIFAIKQIDKKRLLNKIWVLDTTSLANIDNSIIKILGIKKQE